MNSLAIYYHTQRGPLCLFIYAAAGLLYLAAWFTRNEPPRPYLCLYFFGIGLLLSVVATGFHHLTVADEIDRLRIRFGPLPLFQRSVLYEDIQSAEVGRTTILDGWGIHLSFRGGWVWNLWGRDCVVLKLRKGTLRVGTDDAENLAAFVKSRISIKEED
ncbi:hypothetical protein [Gimesia fumaroli]|uniref:Bacterial Pleckstrin homology domain-containing protein n=1 Tax=Gimesia fumaroli TaxID=2527976 RepID=A0A518IHQ3_9PLAN|nr:hypothetical protein [Gimesia fumaroli]QDV52621.1 hypothetical protein Enr17x_46850 [Gimesia fumaroli]